MSNQPENKSDKQNSFASSSCYVIKTNTPAHTGCCGCLELEWIQDEIAWIVKCNECEKQLGWAKTDWGNVEDRIRLGRINLHNERDKQPL